MNFFSRLRAAGRRLGPGRQAGVPLQLPSRPPWSAFPAPGAGCRLAVQLAPPLVSTGVVSLLAALAGLLPAGPAAAALLVQDLDFAFGPLSVQTAAGTHTEVDQRSRMFQQFDPGIGVLTGARWELTSAWGVDGTLTLSSISTNPAAQVSATMLLQAGLDTRLNAAGSLLGTQGQYFSASGSTSAACSTTLAAGPCTTTAATGALFDGTLAVTDLAALIGAGQFEQGVEAAVRSDIMLQGPGGVSLFSQLVWADSFDRYQIGRLRLVYEWQPFGSGDGGDGGGDPIPVPEPGSLLLAATALPALLAAGRRRRDAPVRTGSAAAPSAR